MKKNISKRGLNSTIKAEIAKKPNMNPAEMDKMLKEVAKRYGMTFREINEWLADRI